MKIISTVALGDGAMGGVSFFTRPQGQKMHYLGNIPHDKVPLLDAETTSVRKAGEAAPGNFKVKSITARTSSGLKVVGGFEVFASKKSLFKGALLETYGGPQLFSPAISIKETEFLDVKVMLPVEPALDLALRNPKKPGEKLPFDPKHPVIVLLTLELDVDPA